MSRAAREEGNPTGREKGEEPMVKDGGTNGQVLALICTVSLTYVRGAGNNTFAESVLAFLVEMTGGWW